MAAPQGFVTFPGIKQVVSATYTLAHGITPGVCTLEIAPQPLGTIGAGGNLVFTFEGNTIIIPNCRVDLATASLDENGLIWSLQILDRRWKWAFGEINLVINRRDDAKKVISGSAYPPQDMASDLLDAMGEINFNVSQLPNDARPYREWIGANPAQELQSLCEELGCRIVYGIGNTVRILKKGIGADLPGVIPSVTIENSLSVDPPERPDTIKVIGAATRFQACLELEAVGEDEDGVVKAINMLSFSPVPPVNGVPQGDGGWGNESFLFSSVIGTIAREKALRTVYRWYRPKLDLNNTKHIPGFNLQGNFNNIVTDLDEILPLSDQTLDMAEAFIDFGQGILVFKKETAPRGYVHGLYWIGNIREPINSTDPLERVKCDWSLIEKKGIVDFENPVKRFLGQSTGQWGEAALSLVCTFSIRNLSTGNQHRLSYTFNMPGPKSGTGPEVVNAAEELQIQVREKACSGEFEHNIQSDQLGVDALNLALGAAGKYVNPSPQDGTYAGFLPIVPDGAIEQVTWELSGEGAITRASRNSETSTITPPFKKRRLYEISSAVGEREGLQNLRATEFNFRTGGPNV